MDQELQQAKRDAIEDPEAKDRVIAILERLAGISQNEIKIWVSRYVPPESRHDLGFACSISLTKNQVLRESASMCISMMGDPADHEQEMAATPLLDQMFSHYDVAEYQEIIDLYTTQWDSDCYFVIYQTDLT